MQKINRKSAILLTCLILMLSSVPLLNADNYESYSTTFSEASPPYTTGIITPTNGETLGDNTKNPDFRIDCSNNQDDNIVPVWMNISYLELTTYSDDLESYSDGEVPNGSWFTTERYRVDGRDDFSVQDTMGYDGSKGIYYECEFGAVLYGNVTLDFDYSSDLLYTFGFMIYPKYPDFAGGAPGRFIFKDEEDREIQHFTVSTAADLFADGVDTGLDLGVNFMSGTDGNWNYFNATFNNTDKTLQITVTEIGDGIQYSSWLPYTDETAGPLNEAQWLKNSTYTKRGYQLLDNLFFTGYVPTPYHNASNISGNNTYSAYTGYSWDNACWYELFMSNYDSSVDYETYDLKNETYIFQYTNGPFVALPVNVSEPEDTAEIQNNSTNVSVCSNFEVTLNQEQNLTFNYTAETSPDIGNYSISNASSGLISLDFNWEYDTTYTIFLNVSVNPWSNSTYTFTTGSNAGANVTSVYPVGGYLDPNEVELTPACKVNFTDSNESQNITWYWSTDNSSWAQFGYNASVNETLCPISQVMSNASSTNTTYYIKVNLTDEYDNSTIVFFKFTTLNGGPSLILISPSNGVSDHTANPSFSVSSTDPDGEVISTRLYWSNGTLFYSTTDTGTLSIPFSSVTNHNGTNGHLEFSTPYSWYANVSDIWGAYNQSATYSFTTGNGDDIGIYDIYPPNNTIISPEKMYLSFNVANSYNDPLNVTLTSAGVIVKQWNDTTLSDFNFDLNTGLKPGNYTWNITAYKVDYPASIDYSNLSFEMPAIQGVNIFGWGGGESLDWLSGILFFLLIGVLLLKLFNVLSFGDFYDWRLSVVTFVAGTLAFGFILVNTLFNMVESMIYSVYLYGSVMIYSALSFLFVIEIILLLKEFGKNKSTFRDRLTKDNANEL